MRFKRTIFGLSLAIGFSTVQAHGQACCATGSGLSPARLGLHENYGLGVTLRAAWIYGRFGASKQYQPAAAGTREIGFEQDLFGAIRWLERGQFAVLLPIVQTYRKSHSEVSTGAGVGDVNLAARYDFIWGGRYRSVPGLALLVGLTLPTGTPPEQSTRPLATDATGRGLFQANVGVALEKLLGPTITSIAGIVAWRNRAEFRNVSVTAAPELRVLGTFAYVFPGEQSLGLFGSYATEGNSRINGVVAQGTARRELLVGAFSTIPIGDSFRLRFGLALHPPLDGIGRNQPAAASTFVGLNWSSP